LELGQLAGHFMSGCETNAQSGETVRHAGQQSESLGCNGFITSRIEGGREDDGDD